MDTNSIKHGIFQTSSLRLSYIDKCKTRVHDLWPQRCLCFRTWRRSTAQTCTRSSSQICWTSGRTESSWVIRSLQSVAASNIRWLQTWWIIEYDLYILFHLDHRLYVVLGLNIRFTSCARWHHWCVIFHYHQWTASIKLMLLISPRKIASIGLSLDLDKLIQLHGVLQDCRST